MCSACISLLIWILLRHQSFSYFSKERALYKCRLTRTLSSAHRQLAVYYRTSYQTSWNSCSRIIAKFKRKQLGVVVLEVFQRASSAVGGPTSLERSLQVLNSLPMQAKTLLNRRQLSNEKKVQILKFVIKIKDITFAVILPRMPQIDNSRIGEVTGES
jgi:hypothetical protein